MNRQAPHCPRESGVGIVPAAVRTPSDLESLRSQQISGVGEDLFELTAYLARPRRADELVEVPLPSLIRRAGSRRTRVPSRDAQEGAVEPFHGILQREPGSAT